MFNHQRQKQHRQDNIFLAFCNEQPGVKRSSSPHMTVVHMIKPTSESIDALEEEFKMFKMKPLLLTKFAQWLAYVRIKTQLKKNSHGLI